MRRALWTLAVLAAGAGAAVAWLVQQADQKMQRHVVVAAHSIPVAAGRARIEQGRYLFRSSGCADCHGDNGAGRVVVNEGGLFVAAPNLTAGKGSAVGGYSAMDWERAIRHGVAPGGRPLLIMPSEDYSGLSDQVLGALLAYAQSLPAADGAAAAVRLPLMLQVMYALGAMRDAAEDIDHKAPHAAQGMPAVGGSAGALFRYPDPMPAPGTGQ